MRGVAARAAAVVVVDVASRCPSRRLHVNHEAAQLVILSVLAKDLASTESDSPSAEARSFASTLRMTNRDTHAVALDPSRVARDDTIARRQVLKQHLNACFGAQRDGTIDAGRR